MLCFIEMAGRRKENGDIEYSYVCSEVLNKLRKIDIRSRGKKNEESIQRYSESVNSEMFCCISFALLFLAFSPW